MTTLLKPETIAVFSEGELCVLRIGNTDLKMGYEDFIKLSTWMRVTGRKAKSRAGDYSRRWNIVGNLEAAEAGENPLMAN